MFSQEFLVQIADTYGLTPDQKKVFLQRILDNKSHNEIADNLNISRSACLRRMADVYKKFHIEGRGKGKDSELRNFLITKQEQFDHSFVSSANLTTQINTLNDRMSYIENEKIEREIINSLFPSNPKCDSEFSCQNLPPQSNEFIGREEDLSRLLEYLSEEHANPVITVDGIGGVGKTALVLEAAYRCLKAKDSKNNSEIPKFDAIIFVSAKENYLTPTGIIRRLESQQHLDNIYKAIAFTLNIPCILQASGEEQYQIIKQNLSKQRTLLIVDNFETIKEEEKDKVLGFLFDLPATVKSVITTREQRVIYVSIRLDKLSKEDSLKLILQQTHQKNIKLSEDEIEKLYLTSDGIPLVIIYSIGRLANSVSLNEILENLKFKKLKSESKDLANFIFQNSIEDIKDKPAYYLLLAMSIFHKAPLKDALVNVAGLEAEPLFTVDNNLSYLQRLSLVYLQNGHYRMLAPTREYSLTRLNNEPDFKKQAYNRWVQWYLKFAEKYGRDDWGEWHNQYDFIAREWRNLMAVLEWCKFKGNYDEFEKIWQYLNKCANLYGYWDDRLKCLDWLVKESERKGDLKTFVKVTTAYSWTLILRESSANLEEADKRQQRAWELREQADPLVKCVLAENIAVLRIRQKKYKDALEWFDRYEELITETKSDEQQKQRSKIRLFYYKAEILYREGKYDEAKNLYQKVVEQAEKINWLRFTINAKSWLASIAIKKRKFDEAERLLKICLPIAERNHDKRRTALCQFCFARLEKSKGNLNTAKEWAEKALDSFERLGVPRDIEELNSFIKGCTA